MGETLSVGLVILSMAGVIFGMRLIEMYFGRRTWGEAAEMLSLRLDPTSLLSFPVLSGSYEGYTVEVKAWRGILPESPSYTVYKVSAAEVLPAGMYLGDNLLGMDKSERAPQLDEIEVGMPLLDRTFSIKAEQPHLARQFLRQPAVEAALLELNASHRNLCIYDGTVYVSRRYIAKFYQIEMTLDDIIECLDAVSRRGIGVASTHQ